MGKLINMWRWPIGWSYKASRTWRWNRRGVLETNLQYPGRPFYSTAGECPAPKASAGAQE